jgi:hypothetical protein
VSELFGIESDYGNGNWIPMLTFDIFSSLFERATECQRKFLSFTAPTVFFPIRSKGKDFFSDAGRCFDVNSILWKFVPLFNYNDYHQEISLGLFCSSDVSPTLWFLSISWEMK